MLCLYLWRQTGPETVGDQQAGPIYCVLQMKRELWLENVSFRYDRRQTSDISMDE